MESVSYSTDRSAFSRRRIHSVSEGERDELTHTQPLNRIFLSRVTDLWVTRAVCNRCCCRADHFSHFIYFPHDLNVIPSIKFAALTHRVCALRLIGNPLGIMQTLAWIFTWAMQNRSFPSLPAVAEINCSAIIFVKSIVQHNNLPCVFINKANTMQWLSEVWERGRFLVHDSGFRLRSLPESAPSLNVIKLFCPLFFVKHSIIIFKGI